MVAKLVISDTRNVQISATFNDTSIQTVIEACSEIRLHKQLFFHFRRDKLIYISIWGFPSEFPFNTLSIIKCHRKRSRAHLAVSTGWVLLQTKKGYLCKLILPFMASLAAYMTVACTHDCYLMCIISYQLPTPSEADKKQTPFKPNMVHRYICNWARRPQETQMSM